MRNHITLEFARQLERELAEAQLQLALAEKRWGYARKLELGLAAMQAQPHTQPKPEAMTLRDEFAAAALQGMTANPSWDSTLRHTVAENAYGYANAMLAARQEVQP